jgi:MYXO-CTERM domain-containing protein
MKRAFAAAIVLFAANANAAYETIVTAASPEKDLALGRGVALDGAHLLATTAHGATLFDVDASGAWKPAGTIAYGMTGFAAFAYPSLHGDWAIVTEPSAGILAFHRSGTTWSLATTVATGTSFAFDGVTLASPYLAQVRLYTAGATLTAQPSITGTTNFGTGIAVSGNTLAVDADGGTQIYVKSGTTWTKEASIPDAGRLALDGDRLLLGNPTDGAVKHAAGSVKIYERAGAMWSKTATLVPPDPVISGNFGEVVAVVGDRVLVAATGAGRFYLFRHVGAEWKLEAGSQSRLGLKGPTVGIPYGNNGVALSSSWIAVGTPQQQVSTFTGAGAAFVYPTTCAADDDCAPDDHCGAGTCVASLADGASCDRARQCANGHCTDGVCCELACDGQCEACDVAGKMGACVPVAGAPHGMRAACATDGSCGAQTCDGTLRGACGGYVGAETSCRKKSCTDGVELAAAVCDGSGSCPVSSKHACDGFACDGAACRTTCATSADCVAGFTCRESKCTEITELCGEGGATVLHRDGTSDDCTPYACRAGACVAECTATNDCAPGYLCGEDKHCADRATAVPADSGGGCVFGEAPRAGHAFGLFALLGLAAIARRRRT